MAKVFMTAHNVSSHVQHGKPLTTFDDLMEKYGSIPRVIESLVARIEVLEDANKPQFSGSTGVTGATGTASTGATGATGAISTGNTGATGA